MVRGPWTMAMAICQHRFFQNRVFPKPTDQIQFFLNLVQLHAEQNNQDYLCRDCALRADAKEGGNRLLYLWWSNMPDTMLPINLVLDTPAQALPDKATAGPKADVPLHLRTGPDSSELILRFRMKKHAAQRIWEALIACGPQG